MRRSSWDLFFFSTSAAVLLLLLGLDLSLSSSLVEAATANANRRTVRKTAKARQHHQRNLQSGKGGKGKGKGSGGDDISNNAGLPSGMLATIDAIGAMNHEILQHQNNAKKSSKGSSSGAQYGNIINYGDGQEGSTPTTDPVITGPSTGTGIVIQPSQGGSTEEIVSGGGIHSGNPAEASSPMDTILDSVVSVVNGGGGGANDAPQGSDANTDGAVESSKDDVDVNGDQESVSTPSVPEDTAPSTSTEQDSVSTSSPSTPTDPSTGNTATVIGDSTEGSTDSSTDPSLPPANTNPSTDAIVDDSTGTDGSESPTVIPPTSGTTDESFFDGSTTPAPGNQQDIPQQKDDEHISTDEFVFQDDVDGDNSDSSDDANSEGDSNIVVIMPTAETDMTEHDNQEQDKKGEGKPSKGDKEKGGDFEIDSIDSDNTEVNVNPTSDNDEELVTLDDTSIQVPDVDPNVEEEEDSSINILPSVDSEPSTPEESEGNNLQPIDDGNGEIQDTSPNTETDTGFSPEEATGGSVVTTIPPLGQDESLPSDTEIETTIDPDEEVPRNEALPPTGDDNDGSEDEDGEVQRLDMPEGLVVSIFLSEEESRRLQGSPTDPLKNQEEFEFILNGMGETQITLQSYLARHLNGYLLEGISGLSFVSIDSIAAFLTTKSYQERPTPAIVVKSIEGTTTYRGVEKPSPRILEANTLGAFNTGEGRKAFIDSLNDSDDNILSRTIDVSAEINRGAITPSSDTTSPIASAATQTDTILTAGGGSAARISGIAIGGLIIVVAMFVVGHKLIRRSSKDEIELEDDSSLEHKYDLDSIESETAFSSTLVSYHGENRSGEKDVSSHHRDIVAYDDSNSYPEGTLVLSPVAECPVAEEVIDDLVITKKIQIVAEEPQNEEKIPSPLLRKLYSFSPSSLTRATLGSGLKKEMAATSILAPGRSAYDMSIISPSVSDVTNETPQEQSPDSDSGKSALLLEDGLASSGPDPPASDDINETIETSRAVILSSHSETSKEEEDQIVPSTIDVDAVDSNEAARRLGLGIRSFSDVRDEDEENRLIIKSSPKPVATPERRARPSPAKTSTDSDQHQQQDVWRQQKSQSAIPYVPRAPMTAKNNTPNKKGQENKLYDPIFVNGKVQMKERSPPYRQIFRK